jgi:uncharacterized membrane protein
MDSAGADEAGRGDAPEAFRQEMATLAARVTELERQMVGRFAARSAAVSPAPSSLVRAVDPIPQMPMIATLLPDAPSAPDDRFEQKQSLESRLGSQVFNMVGLLAIVIGASWFLKLAIERGWVGPLARVLIGLFAGAAVVLWSESFRRKGYKAFSYSLKAVGSSVLYLSLWASFQLYHLLPSGVVFAAMLGVTAWNGFMAWTQDAELLAGYGLVGGFLTPFLLANGGDHEVFLFGYVAALDGALALLLRYKRWQRLALPALAVTALYFIGWYTRYFHVVGSAAGWDGQAGKTTVIIVALFGLFAVLSVDGFRRGEAVADEVVVPVLVPLAAAAWLSLAMYSVLQDSGLHVALAWWMVALAALYLGLMRVQATAISRAVHLALAVVFLTVAIPLKASGHSLTTAWLVEGLVLSWVATRFEREEGPASRVLAGLSLAGYALGLASLAVHWLWLGERSRFWTADLGSALVAIGTLGGAVWLGVGKGQAAARTVVGMFVAIDAVAVLLTVRELSAIELSGSYRNAFANVDFWTSVVGLIVLGAVAWAGSRLAQRWESRVGDLSVVAGGTLIAFNLVAVASGVVEIGALWGGLRIATGISVEAELQRSLAISGFLMLYGAVLLTAGFWKRSSFVRWQALVLLIFTTGKVFLFDISGLSQGYRVASFLTLGALLMGISFAYQKDWLGLKAGGSQ